MFYTPVILYEAFFVQAPLLPAEEDAAHARPRSKLSSGSATPNWIADGKRINCADFHLDALDYFDEGDHVGFT